MHALKRAFMQHAHTWGLRDIGSIQNEALVGWFHQLVDEAWVYH